MEAPVPEKGRTNKQIGEALLSGVTPQQLFEAGFTPGSIGYLVYRLSGQHLIERPPGFVGWYQRSQRKHIFERDNYTCQNCGAVGPDVELQLHHKDHNKRNDRSSNRITWCKTCNWEDGAEWAKLSSEVRAERRSETLVQAARVKRAEKENANRLRAEEHTTRAEDRRRKAEEVRVQKETIKVLSRMSSFMGQLAKSFK